MCSHLDDPAQVSQCWCGHAAYGPARHPAYVVCAECGTARLKDARPWTPGFLDGDGGLYSEDYWGRHQKEDLGFPPIEERAVLDLQGRCLHWLSTLLKYVLPPARMVEIGCAHGAFLKLCNVLGFETIGVELADEIIDLARRAFGVDVRKGPAEELDLQFGDESLFYCMFDVLEHLPHPVESLQDLRRRSTGAVTVILQTPEFGDSMPDKMFAVPEHLYLFSRESLRRVLCAAGFPHIAFEDSCFASNATVVASTGPLVVNDERSIGDFLLSTGDGRILHAMLALQSRCLAAEATSEALLAGEGEVGLRVSLRHLRRALVRRIRKAMGSRP